MTTQQLSETKSTMLADAPEYAIYHPIDIAPETRQKGIECVHNCFDRIHRYTQGSPLPDPWEEELSLGRKAYEATFRTLMEELGYSQNFIETQLQRANKKNEPFEKLKQYVTAPSDLQLGLSASFLKVVREDRTLNLPDLSLQDLFQQYEKDRDEINAHYLSMRFDEILSENLQQAAEQRKMLISQELQKIHLLKGEPKGLAAVRAAKNGFKYLKKKHKYEKILEQTPLFAAGNLSKQYDPQSGWGEFDFFSRHAVVIIGKTQDDRLIVSDPLCPNILRFEDPVPFLERTDKMYYKV